MRFGIRFVDHVGSIHEILELTVLAERAGFEFAWYPHDTFMKNTWVTTSAAACCTSDIKIGTVGTNPYTTNPAEIATYVATLDELSGGRAVLGLGMHTEEMVEWTGIEASDYVGRTREAVEVIRRLLTGEVVAHRGKELQWSEQCYLRFKPLRAEIPIYVCAFGPDYLALSGAMGDGSLPMITPPESASYMVPAITRGAVQAGRDPQELDIAGCAWLSLSREPTSTHDALKQMIAYFGPYMEDPALATVGLTRAHFSGVKELITQARYREASEAVTEEMLSLAIVGTPREVIARIEMLAELGITQVNLGGPLGPNPTQAIQLMGEQVIPYFKA